MSLLTLPLELLDIILQSLAPAWEDVPPTTPARPQPRPAVIDSLRWYLSLRLVGRRLDNIIINHLLKAVQARHITDALIGRHALPTAATLAMGVQLLKAFVCAASLNPSPQECQLPFVHIIAQGTEAAVGALTPSGVNGTGHEAPNQIRREYHDALCNIVCAIMRSGMKGSIEHGGWPHEPKGNWLNAALMAAAYLGRIDHMKLLIALGGDLNPERELEDHYDQWTYPALMAAALGGQIQALEFLEQSGVTLSQPISGDNYTAIHFAALWGHSDAVVFLANRGVDSALVDKHGESALLWAAAAGHADVVRELVARGANPNNGGWGLHGGLDRAPLICAVDRGYEEVIVELLRSPALRLDLVDQFEGGSKLTPLSLAAVHGYESIFKMLFARVPTETLPESLLRHALDSDNISIVQTILDKQPELLDWHTYREDETAIIYAANDCSSEMFRYLLSCDGANVNFCTPDGETALREVMRSGDIDKTKALLQHPELDVNLATYHSTFHETPILGWAADISQSIEPEILKEVLAHPAIKVNTYADEYNTTAVGMAVLNGKIDLLRLLMTREDVDKVPIDSLGCTPLMLAAEVNEPESLEVLLTIPETWTDIWHRNRDGKAILQLVAESGHVNMVKRFLDPALGATNEIVREALGSLAFTPFTELDLEEHNRKYEECREILQRHLAVMEASVRDS
ncbi:ankyrin repeat-containing domain protein [Aspergillus crustosus]